MMLRKILILTITSLLLLLQNVSAREVISLNKGWSFGKTITESISSKVDIPHSWDISLVQSGGSSNVGSFHYFREIEVPANWESKKVYIRFNGVASIATVFVNGKYVGKHEGAFTAFTFDLSHYLNYGAKNVVMVYVDHITSMEVSPLTGIVNNVCGIYRDVELIVANNQNISPIHYSSDGVYITTTSLDKKSADVKVDIMLNGSFGDKIVGKVDIYNEDKIVASANVNTTISANGTGVFSTNLSLNSPRRWNGKRDPFMYKAVVRLFNSSKVEIDRVEQNFGIRSFSIDRNKGFILNDESYPLYGVMMNQETAERGLAITKEELKGDIEYVEEIGATAVRFSKAPHDKYQYELCDNNGIIVWSDLPFSGENQAGVLAFVDSYNFKNNLTVQLKEMVWQLYNHPSIVFWGMFSNLAGGGGNPFDFIADLNKVTKMISPDRITVASSNQDGPINNITDAISWSQYFGWNRGTISDFNVWLNAFKKGWLNINPAVGEYGAGGDINTFTDSKNDKSYIGTENNQTMFHIGYVKALANRPYIWSYFVNSMFDSSQEGPDSNMGLVTSNRTHKKDAFYLYKANWNRGDKFIHIADKRDYNRSGLRQNIIVFSNESSLTLMINGKIISSDKPVNGMVQWRDINFNRGENHVEVRSEKLSDSMMLTISRAI